MKITFYLYNAFIIEWDDKKIAIDPGALFAYYFSFAPLIPKSEWNDITHVFITHGDPDHYWHADRVAHASGATVILNKTMVKEVGGKDLVLGPRSKGLTFDTPFKKFQTLGAEETIEAEGVEVSGIHTKHGPLTLRVGPMKKTEYPGPEGRIGWGSIGFRISYQGKSIINLGDTLLLPDSWKDLKSPDILMVPIGGRYIGNTMNEDEALEAVRLIQPKLVIPMHYNCPFLFKKHGNPANDLKFKIRAERMGIACTILHRAENMTY